MNINKSVLALVGTIMACASAEAQVTTVVVTGATAFRAVAFDRAAAIMSGEAVVGGNITRGYRGGTIAGVPGTVNIEFSFTGSVNGMNALRNQTPVALEPGSGLGASAPAQASFTDAFPATAGIPNNSFDGLGTGTLPVKAFVGVTPFVIATKDSNSPDLATVVNLNQRQTTFLFATAGDALTEHIGGALNGNPAYLVGRDTGSGTRVIMDACTYFAGAAANWTWDSANNVPILHPNGGHNSNSLIAADLGLIPNSIGYMSPPDAVNNALRQISYNGVSYSNAAVADGRYELWGYEHLFILPTGNPARPTGNALAVLQALRNAIADNNYQRGIPAATLYSNNFTPLADMKIIRNADGGPMVIP